MSDTVVLALTGLLALAVPGWTVWAIWCTARHTPTRPRALANMLGSIAGTALLGVVLPPVLLGAINSFPIWLAYAALTVVAAAVLAWRWPTLPPGTWRRPGLAITSSLLLVVLVTAGVAVT